ncbi:hypothetical protein SS05631_a46590 (plasmid) [Sinorhizobium sp. CCBAU 05631]|nr:hypothetical protein SS05631_a46590 [Sinorhizobium sp. CCBAU 05631]
MNRAPLAALAEEQSLALGIALDDCAAIRSTGPVGSTAFPSQAQPTADLSGLFVC